MSDRNVEDLEKLIELHAMRHPDDPGLPYFRGVALHVKGETAKAATAFESQLGKELPEMYRESYQREYLLCMLDLGKPVDGYYKTPDAAFAFKFLADLLVDRVDAADALESLIAAHAKRLPDDPSLTYYRSQLQIKRSR